jgi:NAD(P)-dependent dehydrogenase (short-subunit alcohol dehydrogenase family)
MAERSSDRPVALITGASRGIGAATAQELALRGYALVLAARSTGPLETLAGELSSAGCPALPIPTNLCRPDEVRRLAHLALNHFGRVDALIHNAGVGSPERTLMRLSEEQIAAMIATNLAAPIALTRELLPSMLARRRGAIVFVTSVLAQVGMPASAIYTTSKFGLRGFALSLRREVAHHGIGVSIVAPGFIETEMTARLRRVPKLPPESVARAIADALVYPRREVVIPSYYRLAIWLDQMLPGLLDAALRWRAR